MSAQDDISIILPCHNEAKSIKPLIEKIRALHPDAEIIVVNDGSTDDSAHLAEDAGAMVLTHPTKMGNGATIKTGARHAKGDILVFMDSDGQHDPVDITRLLEKMNEGYDMVVGARISSTHASLGRWLANNFYNRLASIMTGFDIQDLTSGFRAARAGAFRKFLYLLPNGFSYPTTSTMAFFRSGFPVAYIPIKAMARQGKSKIRLLKDGTRFFLIIMKIGALFSPMRLFLPVSVFFFTIATCYYAYTYYSDGRFTNMSALLYITSILTFLIGIVSEQISSLHYRHSEEITSSRNKLQ